MINCFYLQSNNANMQISLQHDNALIILSLCPNRSKVNYLPSGSKSPLFHRLLFGEYKQAGRSVCFLILFIYVFIVKFLTWIIPCQIATSVLAHAHSRVYRIALLWLIYFQIFGPSVCFPFLHLPQSIKFYNP